MVMSNSMEEFVVEGVLVMIVGTIGMLLNIIRYKVKKKFLHQFNNVLQHDILRSPEATEDFPQVTFVRATD